MRTRYLLFAPLLLLGTQPAAAQTAADSAAIRKAALDYIEGYYTGDAARMTSAVHAELQKTIVNRDARFTREMLDHMGATRLIEGTRAGFGKQTPEDRRVRSLTILDISWNRAASVKILTGDWVDYLHLARVDGQWKIINVLWEVTPKAP